MHDEREPEKTGRNRDVVINHRGQISGT